VPKKQDTGEVMDSKAFKDEMVKLTQEAYDLGALNAVRTFLAAADYGNDPAAAVAAMRKWLEERSA
jgi:hypothetical protein